MSIVWKICILYLVLVNILAFALMGIDKSKAKHHKWRIQERTLFGSAFMGGSVGALYGMHFFRHKTKHKSFMLGMPAILIIQLVAAICVGSGVLGR